MPTAETNIGRGEWLIGAAFTFRVLRTNTGSRAGTAVAMTGYGLKFVLRRNARDATALISKTTGSAEITIGNGTYPPDDPFSPNGATGGTDDMASVTILETDGATLAEGTYHWALWRTDGTNDRPLAWGTVRLTQTSIQ